MALDATKVRVAVTGALSFAATGTTLPTDATTGLDAAFKDVGYLSDAGAVRSHSVDVSDVTAWQNSAVVRRVVTKDTVTWKFTMIESNDTSREMYYGNIDGATKHVHGVAGMGKRGEWVLHVVDGSAITRVVIPDGQISDWDDVTFASGDAIAYGVTITAYPDGSGNADTTYVA
jgi:hypothetical protein